MATTTTTAAAVAKMNNFSNLNCQRSTVCDIFVVSLFFGRMICVKPNFSFDNCHIFRQLWNCNRILCSPFSSFQILILLHVYNPLQKKNMRLHCKRNIHLNWNMPKNGVFTLHFSICDFRFGIHLRCLLIHREHNTIKWTSNSNGRLFVGIQPIFFCSQSRDISNESKQRIRPGKLFMLLFCSPTVVDVFKQRF